MKSLKKFQFLVAAFPAVFLISCTSFKSFDGGGTQLSINGNAMFGPVHGATVEAFSLNDDGSLNLSNSLGSTTTDTNGHYSLSVSVNSKAFVVRMTGGAYVEEASGQTINLSAKTFSTLVATGHGGDCNAALGALPDMAYQSFQAHIANALASGSDVETEVKNSNYQISQAFGISDVVSVLPDNPLGTISNSDSGKYALIMAAISKSANTLGTDSTAIAASYTQSFLSQGNFSQVGSAPIACSDASGAAVNITPPSMVTLNTSVSSIGDGTTPMAGVVPPPALSPPIFNITPPAVEPPVPVVGTLPSVGDFITAASGFNGWMQLTGGQNNSSFLLNLDMNFVAAPFVAGEGLTKVSAAVVADNAKLISFQGKLYAIWHESVVGSGVLYKIHTAVFNSSILQPGWTSVDGPNGCLNKDATQPYSQWASFAVANNKLYATWAETAGGNGQIRVAVYSGDDNAPTWSFVDGNGTFGINANSTRTAAYPQIISMNSKLYVAWNEFYAAGPIWLNHVSVYNGNDSAPSWSSVDSSATAGIDRNPLTQSGSGVNLAVYNSKLYAVFLEGVYGVAAQVRVSVYNGNDNSPAWSAVDGNAAAGLNYSSSYSAFGVQAVSHNNELYVIWHENATNSSNAHVSVFNGNDLSPVWLRVDGGQSQGLNLASGTQTTSAMLAEVNGTLFTIWVEQLSVFGQIQGQVHVATFNNNDIGPVWTLKQKKSDGTSAALNMVTPNKVTNAYLIGSGGRPFAIWSEADSVGDQIRVAIGPYSF